MNAISQQEAAAAIPQLRAEIERLPKDSGGKRKGISEELKRRIAGIFAASGMPVSEFSEAVSVSISALSSWTRRLAGKHHRLGKPKAGGVAGFKKMSIMAEPDTHSGRFTIEGPNGIRVTGLGADDVARLWRALC